MLGADILAHTQLIASLRVGTQVLARGADIPSVAFHFRDGALLAGQLDGLDGCGEKRWRDAGS